MIDETYTDTLSANDPLFMAKWTTIQSLNQMSKSSSGEQIFEIVIILIILLSIPVTATIIWNIIGAILSIIAIAVILLVAGLLIWLFFFKDQNGGY